VLLARALYKRPKILALDEATSHLDLQREQQVNAAISALRITRVIVAHRPETIVSVSRVVTLDGGKILHDQLATTAAHASPVAAEAPERVAARSCTNYDAS
jgi:ATP-binding cassette, subfamily B, bacterial CvaB/MchF/RaxB